MVLALPRRQACRVGSIGPGGRQDRRVPSTVYGSFARVGELEVPTVAAVRGAAVGAGTNLFMAADLRIVADDARLLAGFLRIGIHPGGGFFTLAGRLAGREAAAALGLFSQAIGMTQEYRLHHFTRRLWAWRQEWGSQRRSASAVGRRAVRAGAAGLWPLVTTGLVESR